MNDIRPVYVEENPDTVQGLVEKAVKGDFEAFGEIYGIYSERIYRYVYYQVKDRMTAEDLAEEIFVKAWESIGKHRKEKSFTSWLYRIAHNHVIDHFRVRRQDEQLTETIPDTADNPEKETEARLLQQELAKTLSCLMPQQRQIIILKYIEGLDNREIGLVMKKRPGAIRVMQCRALAALREKISKGEDKCGLLCTKPSMTA
ncbi:MAG: sigma-70 family RNA polymerase sigma factor [Dehalococcoidales bacterium]|nr:sigma-70 family RNA polymerase sigma factor [Dehalococcoidales bacterium]